MVEIAVTVDDFAIETVCYTALNAERRLPIGIFNIPMTGSIGLASLRE